MVGSLNTLIKPWHIPQVEAIAAVRWSWPSIQGVFSLIAEEEPVLAFPILLKTPAKPTTSSAIRSVWRNNEHQGKGERLGRGGQVRGTTPHEPINLRKSKVTCRDFNRNKMANHGFKINEPH